MPNDILRNVRSSHQSLDPPIQVPLNNYHQRAISNHRNDMLSYKRQLLGSRQESSNLKHIQRLRQNALKQEAGSYDIENKNRYIYEQQVEYSPERGQQKYQRML
jgi:hypothetical protein